MGCTGLAAGITIDTRTVTGDAIAMEDVFGRCSRALYRYFVARTGDAHLADDLMQQLWLQARKSRADIPESQYEFWLRGIAKNLIRSHWRRRARRPANVPLANPELAKALADQMIQGEAPAEMLEQQETRDQLLLAITELDSEEQQLIVEHYFHGCSHADLAECTGLSPRAVEGRLYRARQALREKLKHLVE